MTKNGTQTASTLPDALVTKVTDLHGTTLRTRAEDLAKGEQTRQSSNTADNGRVAVAAFNSSI